jgi:hypothetical protein
MGFRRDSTIGERSHIAACLPRAYSEYFLEGNLYNPDAVFFDFSPFVIVFFGG